MKALTRITAALIALAVLAVTLTLGSSVLTEASGGGEISINAADATITVDGDNSEWAAINGTTVTLRQFDIPPGSDWDPPGVVDPIDATLKVAADDTNIYVLFEVPDDYDFDGVVPPNDHHLSAALAVEFLIDPDAGPHMGAGDSDFEAGLGMVDLWHWELDCLAGAMSGGGPAGSGNDPDCNLDDEYASDPETREDDGGGDPNAAAENSLAGSWSHSGSAGGNGTAGTWTFEMSRPLQTGDPEDAAFAAGGTAKMALAYWDADEGLTGWTDLGHVTSADLGWIVVHLPGVAGTDRVWGDSDCNGDVTPVDALKILRHDAGLSVAKEPGCPDLGTSVSVAD
ncbi:MAG TPA: ethylbenzene dehydrogenase-related protein [Dehalococcoidia bacterium]